ncbi:MAG: Holliday junction resolvase RuvX [Firmicutes bacterium]|nr:Holliday junction resolvase RuvX [Bacillota bacterium]
MGEDKPYCGPGVTPGKILGIDYGMRRIGIAVTDQNGTFASPLAVIPNHGHKKTAAALADLIKREGVELVVMGLPLYRDGNESPMSTAVREFAAVLAETGVAVTFWEESHTSQRAEDHIKNTLGIRNPKKIAEIVDKMAAYMILSEYIDCNKTTRR